MQQFVPSTLSLVAALIYLASALACLVANATDTGRPGGSRAPGFWFLAALVLTGPAIARIFAIEALVLNELRLLFRAHNLTDVRQSFQIPLVFASIALALATVYLAVRHDWRTIAECRSRAVVLAKIALIGLLGLNLIRVISLHATDLLLYNEFGGVLRLNWILDIGFVGLIAMAALWFRRLSRRPAT